jgi:hypothetical protein
VRTQLYNITRAAVCGIGISTGCVWRSGCMPCSPEAYVAQLSTVVVSGVNGYAVRLLLLLQVGSLCNHSSGMGLRVGLGARPS